MTIMKCYVQEYGILLLRLQQCGLTTNEIRWTNWTPEEETSDADAEQSGKKFCSTFCLNIKSILSFIGNFPFLGFDGILPSM